MITFFFWVSLLVCAPITFLVFWLLSISVIYGLVNPTMECKLKAPAFYVLLITCSLAFQGWYWFAYKGLQFIYR